VADGFRRWSVGGAIVESEGRLVLVRNVRRDGRFDWTTPGGVIESGEDTLTGLGREVAEETGLLVHRWAGLCYEVQVLAVDLAWILNVEVHRSTDFSGSLCVGDDPDGIVVEAEWTDSDRSIERLSTAPPWVREPLTAWLEQRWESPERFGYEVRGTDLSTMHIERVDWNPQISRW